MKPRVRRTPPCTRDRAGSPDRSQRWKDRIRPCAQDLPAFAIGAFQFRVGLDRLAKLSDTALNVILRRRDLPAMRVSVRGRSDRIRIDLDDPRVVGHREVELVLLDIGRGPSLVSLHVAWVRTDELGEVGEIGLESPLSKCARPRRKWALTAAHGIGSRRECGGTARNPLVGRNYRCAQALCPILSGVCPGRCERQACRQRRKRIRKNPATSSHVGRHGTFRCLRYHVASCAKSLRLVIGHPPAPSGAA